MLLKDKSYKGYAYVIKTKHGGGGGGKCKLGHRHSSMLTLYSRKKNSRAKESMCVFECHFFLRARTESLRVLRKIVKRRFIRAIKPKAIRQIRTVPYFCTLRTRPALRTHSGCS